MDIKGLQELQSEISSDDEVERKKIAETELLKRNSFIYATSDRRAYENWSQLRDQLR